ncbi:MAG: glycosyltransferase [archaeon]
MKNKLKILLVSEYFPPKVFGGGEISAHSLAKALAGKNHEVFVLTSWFKGLKKFEKKEGFRILRLLKTGSEPSSILSNLKRNFVFQKSLKKEIIKLDKRENFDAIHFLNTTSIPNFRLKKKTFATINGYTNFCPKRNLFYKEEEVCTGCNPKKFLKCITNSKVVGKSKMKWYLKNNPVFWYYIYRTYKKNNNNLKNVKTYFAISGFIRDLLQKNGVKKNNIATIPNIIKIKNPDKRFDIMEKGIIVTYIGPALGKFKGVEMLIKSFNNVKGNAKLLIFGDGPEKEYLKTLAGKNIRFYKTVPYEYLYSIYEQSDIIVHPALWPEPLSRVMVEALFFGKPMVATNNGGNSEGIIDGENGFLFKNEKELTEKLSKIISSSKLRKQMGEKSKEIYLKKFEPEKVLSNIIKNYNA